MNEKLKNLYNDLPEYAIQRTKGDQTGKKYDTSGYGYQYEVDVFNENYGLDWNYTWEIINVREGTFNTGSPFVDITCKVGIWIEDINNMRYHAGSHISKTFGDALKGAISNGFKKTAAMFGVGAKAYRGELDDDNQPQGGDVINYKEKENQNSGNSFKLDFNAVDKELSECETLQQINDYSKILSSEFPNLTKGQMKIIKPKFEKRRKEIETVKTITDDFQGKLVE